MLGAFWKPPGPETCPPWAYFQPQTFTQPAISDHEARRPVGREGAKKDEIEKRFPARVRALQNGPAVPGFPDSRIPGFPDFRRGRQGGPDRLEIRLTSTNAFGRHEHFAWVRVLVCVRARALCAVRV